MKLKKVVLYGIIITVIISLAAALFMSNKKDKALILEPSRRFESKHYLENANSAPEKSVHENLPSDSLAPSEEKQAIFFEESLDEKFYTEEIYAEYVFLDSSLKKLNEVIGLDENRLLFFQERVKRGVLSIEMAEEERFRLITDKPDSTPSNKELILAEEKIKEAQQNFEYDILSILSPDEQHMFKDYEIRRISEYREKSLGDTASYMSSLLPDITEEQRQEISTLVEEYSKKGSKEYRLGVTLQRYGDSPESLTLPNDIKYYEQFKNEYKLILNSAQQEAFSNSKYF